jgi:hypothetical protein
MRRFVPVARLFAVAGLLFGLIATLGVFGAIGVSAQADDVELSIHVLDCPNDAEGDIFEACHDNRIEDAEFDVAGDKVTSDDKGVVEAAVDAGEVDIEEIDFDDIATDGRAIVYCSPQPEGKPLTEYKTTDGSISIEVEAGTEVHCDWYNRTDPNAGGGGGGGGDDTTKVWIHALECPADAEGDIFEACHDNRLEDVVYDINGTEAVSDEDGVATAEDVPTGEVTIEEFDFDFYATSGRAYVYCSAQPSGEPVLGEGITRNGLFTIDVPDDVSEVHCDWYNRTSDFGPTPTDEPGEPTETPEPTNTPQPTATETGGGGGGDTAATATATVMTTLPTTGAGPTNDSSNTGLIFGVILAFLAVSAGAFGLRSRTEGADGK